MGGNLGGGHTFFDRLGLVSFALGGYWVIVFLLWHRKRIFLKTQEMYYFSLCNSRPAGARKELAVEVVRVCVGRTFSRWISFALRQMRSQWAPVPGNISLAKQT